MQLRERGFAIRTIRPQDGSEIWRLAQSAGTLDVNSLYSYMLNGYLFADSCALAVDPATERAIGFLTGVIPLQKPDTLFVWQIGVDPACRGRGVAKALIEAVMSRDRERKLRYVEATISPSNAASRALFGSLARQWRTAIRAEPLFPAEWFGESSESSVHEREDRYIIGPIWGMQPGLPEGSD